MKRFALALIVLLVSATVQITPALGGKIASAQTTTPKIANVSGSASPNGYAGYISNAETGFTLNSSNSSFGATLGRVEIGWYPIYANNSASLRQTVTSWSPSSITATISTGGLAHGSKVFIFVIDSAGAASLGFPVYVQSVTPTIASLSTNVFTHNAIITINGNNFNIRADNHPHADKLAFMWSNFNDDAALHTNPYRPWSGLDNNDVDWRNAGPRTTVTGDGFFRRVDGSDTTTGGLETTIGNRSEYYYASWVRMNVSYTNTSTGQVKLFRQWSTGANQPNWYPGLRADGGASGWVFAFEFHGPEVTNSCQDYEYMVPVNGNQWVFLEMFLKRASAADSRDGEMWFKINNRLAFDWYKNFSINQAIPCFSWDNSGEFDDDGSYDSTLQAGPSYAQAWTSGSYVDADEIYYDATQARVVVGNASTFSGSSAFELQLPVSWSNNAIQVRLNRGAFTSLSGKWLYVVDRFGVVNENGFQLGGAATTSSTTAGDVGRTIRLEAMR